MSVLPEHPKRATRGFIVTPSQPFPRKPSILAEPEGENCTEV